MTKWLIGLVASGGLLAIFVTMAGESAGLPISSEIVVPLGGALASQGRLPFWGVVAASSLGNLAGSLVAYLLVRRYGERFILGPGRRIGLHRGHLRLANRFFNRFGVWAVFLGRLLPVIRTYISFPAGLSRIGVVTFSVAAILGAEPWNLALAYAGYRLGQTSEVVGRLLGPLAIPFAIVVVLLLGACSAANTADNGAALRAIDSGRSGAEVTVSGQVAGVLPPVSVPHGAHERFLLDVTDGTHIQQIFVADNGSISRQSPLHVGDPVVVRGELAFNARGPVIHWTHRDPRFRHMPGFIEVNGQRYE